ncbi:reverse transcriptase domain-containing protein [uncultured Parabacteroides sp.]|uniref:reverse transcriptase domain-containing protein n=1 Tax=uncultured Parabacteroides sp. TaxID=512312 RepID=UPI002803A98D|nr:reverse transcriptase domain-containing protein [uncultured Parabacteroides sp.]MBD9165435.1 Retron-type reverse transcriptase [Parabacteroides johnsonii]
MDLLEDIFTAYFDARKGKRNSANQLRFELNLEENLIALYREVKEHRYRVGRSICFMVDYPVKREVFAADFRDRIVHHLLFNHISPIFERTFINDCYSCRKGKGTLYGIKRLDKHIRSCSHNYTRDCYVLKLDLQGYFMNINRQVLFDSVRGTLEKYGYLEMPSGIHWEDSEEKELADYLLPLIIFNDPTQNCVRRGDISDWEGLPPSKSLFHSPPGHGLPIGNLTSQLFSNIYLTPFDNYVKRTLGVKYYGRYVDDFFLVHEDREVLKALIPKLRDYLWDTMNVRLHPKKIVLQHYSKGVEFLGAVVKPGRIYIQNRAKRKFASEMYYWEKDLGDNRAPPDHRFLIGMRASVNSYLGIMQHFCSHNIKKEVVGRCSNIFLYGYFCKGLEKYVLLKKWNTLSL